MAQTTSFAKTNLDLTPAQWTTGSSGSVTSGAATASMGAIPAGKMAAYVTGFDITGTGTVTATTAVLSGTGSGNITYQYAGGTLAIQLPYPMPCVAGTTSSLTVSAVGGTTPSVSANIYGFFI